MSTMPESKVKELINKMLKRLFKSVWIFMPVQFGMGKMGVPDHIAVASVEIKPEMVGKRFGMVVAIEAKRFKKEPTALQYSQIADIVGADGQCDYCAGAEEIPQIERNLIKRFQLDTHA